MRLIRTGNAKFEKDHDGVLHFTKDRRVGFRFKDFGLGSEKTSTLRVDLTWEDVEHLILLFVEVGAPEAIELEKDRGLVAAIKDRGWEQVRKPKRRFSLP